MLRHLTLHGLGAWLRRSRSTDERVGPTPVPPPQPDNAGVVSAAESAGYVPQGEPTHLPAGIAAAVPGRASAPEWPAAPPPAPLESHHERGLRLAEAHRWNWAQRALEQATRAATDGAAEAAADLASVREVRRQLRVLRKWPRDVPAHLALGRCYFELGLGADAEETFRRVLTLAPDEPAAPCFLALEYAFRGAWPAAEDAYARARALAPELPPFADWLHEQGSAPVGKAVESCTG